MQRSQSSFASRNQFLSRDVLPKDVTERKAALEQRINLSQQVGNRIFICRQALLEKRTKSQEKIKLIESQGQENTQAIRNKIKKLEEQIQLEKIALKDKQFEIQQEIENEHWEMHLEEQKTQLEIQYLEKHPKLKSQLEIDKLKKELEQLKSVNNPRTTGHDCPVCHSKPLECHGCLTCDNWVCQDCKGQVDHCPQCRQDLGELPLRRNRAVERIIFKGEKKYNTPNVRL